MAEVQKNTEKITETIVMAPPVTPTAAPATAEVAPTKFTKQKMIFVGVCFAFVVFFYFANNKIVTLQRRNDEIIKILQKMDPKFDLNSKSAEKQNKSILD